ncbi:hypothetical protein MSG28_000693 [Choristoneura fumiferana]|uniref:Uncharacterized protein n=1 Tax=Choristoneura fumiferana TaxID=7141 RepID=A0ACC0K2C8_CHOFU|nr:hypothetical protein MSG28_000693 [Choristoneura fumiferana]
MDLSQESFGMEEDDEQKNTANKYSQWQLSSASPESQHYSCDSNEYFQSSAGHELQILQKKETTLNRPIIPATKYEKLAFTRSYVASSCKTEFAFLEKLDFSMVETQQQLIPAIQKFNQTSGSPDGKRSPPPIDGCHQGHCGCVAFTIRKEQACRQACKQAIKKYLQNNDVCRYIKSDTDHRTAIINHSKGLKDEEHSRRMEMAEYERRRRRRLDRPKIAILDQKNDLEPSYPSLLALAAGNSLNDIQPSTYQFSSKSVQPFSVKE